MSHAFIDEDAFVPAVRATRTQHPEPPSIQWALMDLKSEGIEHLKEIASDYDIDPQFLLGRWMRAQGDPAHY